MKFNKIFVRISQITLRIKRNGKRVFGWLRNMKSCNDLGRFSAQYMHNKKGCSIFNIFK